jgi:hypothetical protein
MSYRLSAVLIATLATRGISPAQTTPTPAPTGTVSGHVFCADTHTPCRFASVTIEAVPQTKGDSPNPLTSKPRDYSASTDLDGAFQITGVIPGDYYVFARLTGYFLPYDLAVSEFSEDSPLRAKAIDAVLPKITVNAGLTTTSPLNLTSGASLSGTVRFDDGGVASILRLHLYRKDGSGKWKLYLNRSGDSVMAPLGLGTHTDSRGHFSELGLPQGVYCIEIMLPEVSNVSNTITGNPSVTYTVTTGDALRVYNGDKYRLRDATPIELHDGEDRSGIDINIPTNSLHSLRGVVVAKADGHTMTEGKVRLLDPDEKTMLRESRIEPDGTFSFRYLVKGAYLLRIEGASDSHDDKTGTTYEPIEVPLLVEKDVSDLSYSLTPAKK